MSSRDTVTLSLLFSTKGVYILGYGWLCGMSLWVTFFEGVIAHRVLPRQQFGALQHRIFPVYFSISLCISSVLLALWVSHHPNVLTQLDSPSTVDVAQVYALASVIGLQGINRFVVGPMTSKTMVQRQRLEKVENSTCDNKTVSDELKVVNTRFGILHGISALANLGAITALILHGLCLGAEVRVAS